MSEKDFCILKRIVTNKDLKLRVSGISMLPVLTNGDFVYIHRTLEIKTNDIVAYFYKGNILVHRVLRIANGIYWCKGDNTVSFERVKDEDLLGAVTKIDKI